MKSHRPERVAHVIRQVVSDVIATKLNDPRIAPFSSVTRVEMSPDLEHARVFVSVMGEPPVQRRTIAGLRSAAGMIQRMLAGELSLRHCPRLAFELDESIKKGAETIRLINEAMAEIEGRGADVGPASCRSDQLEAGATNVETDGQDARSPGDDE